MSDLFRPLREPPLGRANIDPEYPYGRNAAHPDLDVPVSKSWLFEIVERETGLIRESFTLILPPQSITIKEPQRVSITKTFGNAFVDDYGPDNIQITIKAISGTAHVFPTFVTRGNEVNISDVGLLADDAVNANPSERAGFTGRDAFYTFRRTIMRYKDTDGWDKNELRVYDLADEQAFKCVLLDFTMDRNADMPIHRYPFTISLFVYQRFDKLITRYKPVSFSDDPISALNNIDDLVGRLEAAYQEFQNIINNAALLSARALELRTRYNQFLDQVTQVITSPLIVAKNLVDIAFTGIGIVADTYTAGKFTLERYMESLELLRETLNNGLRIYGFQIAEGWQVAKTITLEQDAGVEVPELISDAVSRGVNPLNYEYSGLSVVIIGGDDTLQSIAKQNLGDESLWPYIAAVNDGISNNDDLVPGEELFIPIQVEPAEGQNKEQFILTEDASRDPYGSDIRLDANGNLVIQENSDLALISGIENVKQAIDLRLNTEVGSLIKQSAYGITAQAGFAGTSMAIRYLKLSIRSTVIQDPRIQSVDNLIASLGKDVLHVSMNITPVGIETSIPISMSV